MATSETAAAPTSPVPEDLDDDDKTLMASPVNWSQDTVKALHRIVYEETMRTMVKHQFLPHSELPARATTVPLNLITPLALDGSKTAAGATFKALTIDEGQFARVYELWIELGLTDQQVKDVAESTNPESTSMAAITRMAAQYHALAHDYVTFQGAPVYSSSDPFFSQYVGYRQGQLPLDAGLLGFTLTPDSTPPYTFYPGAVNAAGTVTAANPYVYTNTPVPVPPRSPAIPGVVWGDNMLTAVASLVATITDAGNPGPFALILHTVPFADLSAPAGPESLAITLDRVAPFFKAGVFSTNALPSTVAVPAVAAANPGTGTPAYYTGVIVSVGGNAVSSGVGQVAKLRHMQRDPQGWHRFRLMGRHILLVSDVRAVGQLVIKGPPV